VLRGGCSCHVASFGGDVGAVSSESVSHSGGSPRPGQTARDFVSRTRPKRRETGLIGGDPELPDPPGWAVPEPLGLIPRSRSGRRRGPTRVAVGIARRLRVGPAIRAARTHSEVGAWRRVFGYPVAAVTVSPSEAAATGTALLSRVSRTRDRTICWSSRWTRRGRGAAAPSQPSVGPPGWRRPLRYP